MDLKSQIIYNRCEHVANKQVTTRHRQRRKDPCKSEFDLWMEIWRESMDGYIQKRKEVETEINKTENKSRVTMNKRI